MNYSNDLTKAKINIQEADTIVVGVGSGMTASGGFCYTDPALARKWYPKYYEQGKQTIFDIMGGFWPNTITERNATSFWGFWARHIWHIRFEPDVLPPYANLFSLIKDKDFYIVSTNVDGQLEKAGFPKEKIFAPQGDYALLQCSKHCYDKVFYNRLLIESMIKNMPNTFEIRQEDIPRCPGCGAFLMPNLRCDFNFVEAPHISNMDKYESFIACRQDKRLVFLELGVGMNTPGIIRYPFEQMVNKIPSATLIRIDRDDVSTVFEVQHKVVFIQADLATILSSMMSIS